VCSCFFFFFFQAEDGIRDGHVTGVQTCALPIWFSSAGARASLESDGIRTIVCDLVDPAQIAALPRCPHVLFLAGRKFGTTDRTDLTWAINTVVPARVCEHFRQSRIVVFSTGNVYSLVPRDGRASTEDDAPAPVGEYAQSCLGRERVVEFVSRQHGMP